MLLTSLIFFLLSSASTTRKDLTLFFNRNLISILIIASFIIVKSINYIVLKEGIGLFGGLFHNTNLSMIFHGFFNIISLIIIQLTAFLPHNTENITPSASSTLEESNKTKEQYTITEYPLIILFIVIGAIFLMSSSDILSIFISIELQSYGLYLLCVLYRDSESSTGAGLTYFLLGGLTSCFYIIGFRYIVCKFRNKWIG